MNGVRYELTELLGRGGQGEVYAVKGGRLAVKIVTGRSQHSREQMRNQLAQVRRLPLRDLSLARPLEMLRPPQVGYVMELLTGMIPIKSLLAPPKGEAPSADWYFRTGSLRRRLLILGYTAHVLAQLHGRGLAYSDPSPANIFVSRDTAFAEVWFIDTDNLCYESAPGSLASVYTPSYGAPELVRGESGITTLTDIHAFAVIAFQVLTLVHPFVGDLVNDGEPELEEQALAGFLPWVDEAEDERNRASFGVPRNWVLSSGLRKAFDDTFGQGRKIPTARPGAAEWAERLFVAADATVECPNCLGTFYFTETCCTWCELERPTFVLVAFYLWDPSYGTDGGILTKPQRGKNRPLLVGHGTATTAQPFRISRRLAFGQMGATSNEPVVEVQLLDGRIRLRSLNRAEYRLVSASGGRQTIVGEQPQAIQLSAGWASWSLHFGDRSSLHRVVTFELRPGRTG